LKTIIRFDEKKNSLVPFEMVRNIVFGAGISDAEMIKSWILNLPKRLYQLRNKDLVYSEQILLFISQFLSKLNIENAKEFLESLDKNITPLFYAFLERGPIAGPVVHFRVELQEKVLNILYYLDTWSLQLTKAICYACQHPQFPASSVGYVMDLATARQLGAQKLNLDLFYSFKLSCMLGISRFELDELKSSQTGPAGLIIDPKEDKVFLGN
jgi:hypothetical protein